MQTLNSLSLILLRTQEQPILIGFIDGKPIAVFLGDQHQFLSFPCEHNTSWEGFLITGIALEVDESSVFNPDRAATLLRQEPWFGKTPHWPSSLLANVSRNAL